MKNTEKTGELSTILGKGTIIEGKMNVEHSLRVDGKVKGDIETTDSLVIGKEGEVNGNVNVKTLIVGGRLVGSVQAETKIVLENKAFLQGEIKTSKLVIHEGAIFNGKCAMSGEEKASKPNPVSLLNKKD